MYYEITYQGEDDLMNTVEIYASDRDDAIERFHDDYPDSEYAIYRIQEV